MSPGLLPCTPHGHGRGRDSVLGRGPGRCCDAREQSPLLPASCDGQQLQAASRPLLMVPLGHLRVFSWEWRWHWHCVCLSPAFGCGEGLWLEAASAPGCDRGRTAVHHCRARGVVLRRWRLCLVCLVPGMAKACPHWSLQEPVRPGTHRRRVCGQPGWWLSHPVCSLQVSGWP